MQKIDLFGKAWDKQLCQEAGANLTDTLTVQFYPEETRVKLRRAEVNYLDGRGKEVKDIKRTFFKVVPDGSDYKFEVTDMLFR